MVTPAPVYPLLVSSCALTRKRFAILYFKYSITLLLKAINFNDLECTVFSVGSQNV
jgi:hypothetical protein